MNDDVHALEALREEYRETIRAELEQERDRKKSLEQRGITVITSASAVASLVFAISAFVTKSTKHANFGASERWPIKASIVAFLVAAFLGLMTNFPFRYGNIKAAELHKEFERVSAGTNNDKPAEFRKNIDGAYIDILTRSQFVNFWKSEILLLAFLAEVVAVGFLAVAVYRVLNGVLG